MAEAPANPQKPGNWILSKDSITASVSVVFSVIILQRILQVVRAVVFARVLGPEQYGIYVLGMFLVPLLATIASLGVQSAYGRYVFRYESQGTLTWFLRKTYSLTAIISVVFAGIMLIRPSLISSMLYGDPHLTWAIVAVAASIPAYLLIRNLAMTFMGLKLFRAGAFPEFLQMVIYLAVGIPLALLLRQALAALLGYAIATYASVAVFGFLLVGHLRRLEPSPQEPKEPAFYGRLLRFSLWFVVTPVLSQVFHYVDRLSLQHLKGAYDQGVYSAAVNVAETLSAFGLAISNVIYPHISSTWEKGDREKARKDLDLATRVTGVLLLVLGLLIVLFAKWFILLLLGRQYVPGTQALPYLVVFYIFSVLVWLFGVYPTLIERTYVTAIGLVVALPVNIVLNRALIPSLGMVGAALATMLAYFLMWCIVVFVCRAYGLRVTRRTIGVSLLPFVLLMPEVIRALLTHVIRQPPARAVALVSDGAAVLAVCVVLYICMRRTWILTVDERNLAMEELRLALARAKKILLRRG